MNVKSILTALKQFPTHFQSVFFFRSNHEKHSSNLFQTHTTNILFRIFHNEFWFLGFDMFWPVQWMQFPVFIWKTKPQSNFACYWKLISTFNLSPWHCLASFMMPQINSCIYVLWLFFVQICLFPRFSMKNQKLANFLEEASAVYKNLH